MEEYEHNAWVNKYIVRYYNLFLINLFNITFKHHNKIFTSVLSIFLILNFDVHLNYINTNINKTNMYTLKIIYDITIISFTKLTIKKKYYSKIQYIKNITFTIINLVVLINYFLIYNNQ